MGRIMNLEEHFTRVPESKDTKMRPYRTTDIPLLVECTARIVPELPNYEGITVDKEWLANCLTRYYGNSAHFQCWVLTDEHDNAVGGGAGFCVTGLLTRDIYASDAFWFVLPNWRTFSNALKPLRAYKQWALARGAVSIKGSMMGGYKEDILAKIMEKEGFDRVGTIYQLRMDTMALARRLSELRSAK